MLFNSFEFLLFLPIVFTLYWFVFNKSLKWQNGLVLVASYFFYGWWSWKFMGLLMLSTALDYAYGFWVASPNRKKAKFFLWLSIINNLGILAVFKYYNFFATQFQHGLELLGLHTNPVLLNVALPIGISFYTFHGMSYVFDIYRGQQTPVKNFVDYAVFVSFFPLLVAGPIERANHLLPQVLKKREFHYKIATDGIRLIIWGMFKKVVLADMLSPSIDSVYSNYNAENGIALFWTAIAFSIQIYCDFSGYSDIARGTAKLFGFELLLNFRFPYLSRNLAEFWSRWHISLSSWFRDYLYIPLGGSQKGKVKTRFNIFLVFLVSGFWHGASWNFIFWGVFHGFILILLNIFNKDKLYRNGVIAMNSKWPTFQEIINVGLTFIIVTFSWILFRIENIADAIRILKNIIFSFINQPKLVISKPVFSSVDDFFFNQILISVSIVFFIDWINRREEDNFVITNKKLLFVFSVLCIYFLSKNINKVEFIYFQF